MAPFPSNTGQPGKGPTAGRTVVNRKANRQAALLARSTQAQARPGQFSAQLKRIYKFLEMHKAGRADIDRAHLQQLQATAAALRSGVRSARKPKPTPDARP